MEPKVIFLLYNGDKEDQPALEKALELSAAHGACINAWHITPDVEDIVLSYAPYSGTTPEAVIEKIEQANEENRQKAKDQLFKAAADKKIDNVFFHAATGTAGKIIGSQGRLSDLIIMARSEKNIARGGPAIGALVRSARPVMLVPPRPYEAHDKQRALVAWNGKPEAARAVAFALPYLAQGKVSILTHPEKKKHRLTADDLAQYLKRHGMAPEILTGMEEDRFAGKAILDLAHRFNAGMIVMGAWSHTRLGEFILGGVTEYMLHHADIPVLMAH